MVVRTRFRHFLYILTFQCVVLGASFFFAWHAYTGDRGIMARREHKVRIAQLNRQLDELKIERSGLERRVAALSTDEVDRDILDERARMILNIAHKNDVIIVLPHR